MLIAGFWHGARWGFVVWGGCHGLALVVHRLNQVASEKQPWLSSWWQSPFGSLTVWSITQMMVFTTWLFFRLPTLKEAWGSVTHLFGKVADPQFAQKVDLDVSGLERSPVAALILLLVLVMAGLNSIRQGLKVQVNWPLKLALVPLCFYAVLQLAPQGELPYIYFDF
jgi:alginate O-acetyltransferase complex protein AlgI